MKSIIQMVCYVSYPYIHRGNITQLHTMLNNYVNTVNMKKTFYNSEISLFKNVYSPFPFKTITFYDWLTKKCPKLLSLQEQISRQIVF